MKKIIASIDVELNDVDRNDVDSTEDHIKQKSKYLDMINKYESLLKILKNKSFRECINENKSFRESSKTYRRADINFSNRRSKSVGNRIRHDTPRYPINMSALKKVVESSDDNADMLRKWINRNFLSCTN